MSEELSEERKKAIRLLVNAYYQTDEKDSMTLRQYLNNIKKISTIMTDADIQYGVRYARGKG